MPLTLISTMAAHVSQIIEAALLGRLPEIRTNDPRRGSLSLEQVNLSGVLLGVAIAVGAAIVAAVGAAIVLIK